MQNELLTVQEFADVAGISKQAVYKALNNKLKPFVQLVDGKKMLKNQALREVYGVEVEQLDNSTLNKQSQPLEAVIDMLQRELEAKDRQIEELQAALKREQELHTSAQILHSQAQQIHAAMLQQLPAPAQEVSEAEPEQAPNPKKKGWKLRWKKK